jgi:hypothetical protein
MLMSDSYGGSDPFITCSIPSGYRKQLWLWRYMEMEPLFTLELLEIANDGID